MFSVKLPGSDRVKHILAEAVATVEEVKKIGGTAESLYEIVLKNGVVIQGIAADLISEIKALLHPAAPTAPAVP